MDKIYTIDGLPAVDEAGDLRVLGCLPPCPEGFSCSSFGEAFGVLPESEWRETDLSWIQAPVLDQKRTSSCVGHATCTSFTRAYQLSGDPFEDLSPYFIYGLINGGRDNGAQVEAALTACQEYGVCRVSDIPAGAMYQQQFPPQAFEEAKKRKLLSGYICRTLQDIASALTLRFPVVVGIMVGSNFGRLDSEGVCPLPDQPLGGHALAIYGLKKSSRYGWILPIQNSWSTSWGNQGRAALRKEHLPFYGQIHAFALQAVSDVPSPNDPPPIVLP